jgi:hypothetical protein
MLARPAHPEFKRLLAATRWCGCGKAGAMATVLEFYVLELRQS